MENSILAGIIYHIEICYFHPVLISPLQPPSLDQSRSPLRQCINELQLVENVKMKINGKP